jgi:opacity protein-like surface antigen
VQIGYNWQFAPLWVLGFEADIQGAAITSDRTAGNTGTATERFAGTSLFSQRVTGANSIEALVASFTNASITANGLDSVAADLNWFGTVRGRLGYLFTPNLLFYVTGGLAYGGVSVSATDTLNLTNLSADSFALAYGQASGPGALVTLTATTNPNVASADAIVNTTNIQTHQTVTAGPGSSVSLSATISGGAGTSVNFSGQGTTTPPTITGLATGSGPGQTVTSLTQASKGLSVALANTAQSFVHFSDTRVGGTIGGGFEWMMAPNWSFKAEALYYDLGSVTISTPITTSINPITAPIPATVAGTSTAGVTGAINKFTGSSTITNTATTHVNFQGVIVRVGLNYHFNFL